MEILIVDAIAIIVIILSIRFLIRKIQLVATFPLNNDLKEFDIDSPGDYSISIVGAGYISEEKKLIVHLTLDNQVLKVNQDTLPYRFKHDGEMTTEYCSFVASRAGSCEFKIDNTQDIEAKESMLMSKRLFMPPISHTKLKLIIHKRVKPTYRLIAIVSLVFGSILLSYGIRISLNL